MIRSLVFAGFALVLAASWMGASRAEASGSYVASPFSKKKKAGEPAAEATPTPTPTETPAGKAAKPGKK